MSKRQVYLPHELRSGRTVFIVTADYCIGQGPSYGVAEYLITSAREPQPEPGTRHPYRMHPKIAAYAHDVTDLFRTRRGATREAARRQACDARQIAQRNAVKATMRRVMSK